MLTRYNFHGSIVWVDVVAWVVVGLVAVVLRGQLLLKRKWKGTVGEAQVECWGQERPPASRHDVS